MELITLTFSCMNQSLVVYITIFDLHQKLDCNFCSPHTSHQWQIIGKHKFHTQKLSRFKYVCLLVTSGSSTYLGYIRQAEMQIISLYTVKLQIQRIVGWSLCSSQKTGHITSNWWPTSMKIKYDSLIFWLLFLRAVRDTRVYFPRARTFIRS